MRPGYWHGSGVVPALKQDGAALGLIYHIPEEHPLHYIHLYAPECRFDEVRKEGQWMLFRMGNGYLGFWASAPMEPWNGMNFGCEQRIWGSRTACMCVCAGRETKDMDAFAQKAFALSPRYDADRGLLTSTALTLEWTPGEDDTQYL